MCACHIAQTKPVVVMAEDTDVLVLLQHHYTPTSHHTIYMQTGTRLIDISRIQKTLDVELSRTLLFIHALSGCDATSRPYGIGKTSAMSKYRSLTEYSKVFLKPNQQRADVEEAGNHALAILYGGTSRSDLNLSEHRDSAEGRIKLAVTSSGTTATNIRRRKVPQSAGLPTGSDLDRQ